jgi:hypothetical protein
MPTREVEQSMSKAAVSILAFGIYLATGGFLLAVAPGLVCRLLALAEPPGLWMRIAGGLCGILAYYCIRAAREEEMAFIRWSVKTRPTTLVFLAVCVAANVAPPTILILGVIDVAATIWTALALRADASTAASQGPSHTAVACACHRSVASGRRKP